MAPDNPWNFPIGQLVQLTAPATLANMPATQDEHCVSPALAEYVPAAHAMQLDPDRNVPAAQVVVVPQLVAPAAVAVEQVAHALAPDDDW